MSINGCSACIFASCAYIGLSALLEWKNFSPLPAPSSLSNFIVLSPAVKLVKKLLEDLLVASANEPGCLENSAHSLSTSARFLIFTNSCLITESETE